MNFFPILLALLATIKVKRHIRTDHLLLQQIRRDSNSVVWVDLENVRGKSGFELTHDQALQKTAAWTKFHNLMGKVIFVVDHGSVKKGYLHKDMSIVFAGPSEKADDVIANGVPYFHRSVVITADTGLQQRCRRGAPKNLHIMDPAKFLDDLELVDPGVNLQPMEDETGTEGASSSVLGEGGMLLSLEEQIKLGKLDDEIRLHGQILDAEIQMYKKKQMTKKRRKKLQSKIDKVRQKLALRGPSLLDEITSVKETPNHTDLGKSQSDMLLSRWREIQTRTPRREQTGDRVIYAEQLRRQVMENAESDFEMLGQEENTTAAKSFLMHVNGISQLPLVRPLVPSPVVARSSVEHESKSLGATFLPKATTRANSTHALLKESSGRILDSLTIVAVSDTHGFEGQLIVDPESRSEVLPDGDVLLHLGDFARDGSRETEQKGLLAFDSWLAKQPHRFKIVVRGNHDPWTCEFSESGAWYVTKPSQVKVGNFDLALIPHGSARTLTASGGLPKSCDILATHVPPYKTLDRTFSGKYAGSQFLTKTVRNMRDKTPRLWLCGHIHEGRGKQSLRFGSRETLVVNAANANAGRATHLIHGPSTIRLDADHDQLAEILKMDSKSIEPALESSGFFAKRSDDEDIYELLLSVDLGLKSGVALFTQEGTLLRYEQFFFRRDTLEIEVQRLVQEWEEKANMASHGTDQHVPSKITHIAIEGADVSILKGWTEAAPNLSILRVSPEEWRSGVLTEKERASGADSKAASRLIARQIVSDFGTMLRHEGKFPTDVAEAVVMGSYVAGKLGWISRNPLIRRYTNGNIVVPKKA